ncbi:hypothetical protein [Myxococcus sp. CA040A]|uniref:hypothetical protein n=1 Tax=Myxococcus sp. CA040A TaxID=2741738 RepID=UPI00157AC569|nr:hypothetical protein [Myxococcus sp. CA040A]
MRGGWRWATAVGMAVFLGACGDSADADDIDSPDGPGPWPTDAVKDYAASFGIGAGVQSIGVDEGHNIWLLKGAEIGVLRPGDTAPTWTRGVGQATEGFGRDKKALGSTVICGGEAGRAYVGYHTYELQPEVPEKPHAYIPVEGEPHYSAERFAEYQKGDLDAVRLGSDGKVELEEHLWRSAGVSGGKQQLGLRNTNDFHYDEDRSVLTCQRVMRGRDRGDVYIGTNHGVTLIRGLTYNSHRHAAWYRETPREDGSVSQSLQAGFNWGLGLGPDGEVLVANDWLVGILEPNGVLEDFDTERTWEGPVPWSYKGHNSQLNSLEEFDNWRAIARTKAGATWVGSRDFGLWRMEQTDRSSANYTRITALPSDNVTALAATDKGIVYVGTDDEGLWRIEEDAETLTRLDSVNGKHVLQLVYDPTVAPAMLYVLTDAGLTVLRE